MFPGLSCSCYTFVVVYCCNGYFYVVVVGVVSMNCSSVVVAGRMSFRVVVVALVHMRCSVVVLVGRTTLPCCCAFVCFVVVVA